jgi:hypothetical protein
MPLTLGKMIMAAEAKTRFTFIAPMVSSPLTFAQHLIALFSQACRITGT